MSKEFSKEIKMEASPILIYISKRLCYNPDLFKWVAGITKWKKLSDL